MIIVDQYMNENYSIVIQNDLNMINEECTLLLEAGAFSNVLEKIKTGLRKIKEYVIKKFKKIKEHIQNLFKKNKSINKSKNTNTNSGELRVDTNFSIKEYTETMDKVYNMCKKITPETDNILNIIMQSKMSDESVDKLNNIINELENSEDELRNEKLFKEEDYSDLDDVVTKVESNGTGIDEINKFIDRLSNEINETVKKMNSLVDSINDIVNKLFNIANKLESSINSMPDPLQQLKTMALYKVFNLTGRKIKKYYDFSTMRFSSLTNQIELKIFNKIQINTL